MKRSPRRFYEFDGFRIDLEERLLSRDGAPLPLTPKVFDILLTLVENNGHTVEKDKLMESVWADAYVEEGNLNRNVSTLRKALGEDSHAPRFIKTVPKRGYRFESDVHEIVEEDEEVVVERRTKYSFAVKEERDVVTSRKSSRLAIVAMAAGVAVILAIAWAAFRSPTSTANSLAGIAPGESRNAEAQELYRKGRILWQNRTAEGLHQATAYLEQAIRLDPEFALAHAALADAYAFDVGLWKKAEATANEAMRLDPRLGQPHATIGFIRMFWEWRLHEAGDHFKEAIALSPDYATAHQWYAFNLVIRNQLGSGHAEIKRALELEPDSVAINSDYCQILYLSRKYDKAIEQCHKALGIDPNFRPAHQLLYAIYTAKEMYPEAIDEYFKAEDLNMTSSAPPSYHRDLRNAYSSGGIRAFWREQIKIHSLSDRPHAFPMAQYHALLGNVDEALFWFNRSGEARDFDFLFFADPLHQKVLADPRSKDLVTYLGL